MSTRKTTEKLRTNLATEDLSSATLAEVLLHGLSAGEDDPALGVLSGVLSDLETLTSMACSARAGEPILLDTLANTLGGLTRRVEVVQELLARRGSAAD